MPISLEDKAIVDQVWDKLLRLCGIQNGTKSVVFSDILDRADGTGTVTGSNFEATAPQGSADAEALFYGGTGTSGVCLGGYPGAFAALYLGVTPSSRGTSNYFLAHNGSSGYLNAGVSLSFGIAGNTQWQITSTTLQPIGNNTKDLGGSSNRIANLYMAGNISDGTTSKVLIGGGGGTPTFQGGVADGASAVGVILNNTTALSNAGAKLVSIRNAGSEKAYFDTAGGLAIGTGPFMTVSGSNGKIFFQTTDSSGTPGAATINKPSGQVAIAAGASQVVVTNSLVATTSVVYAVVQQTDATLLRVDRVVPAAGSFTIIGNANATAATKVGFVVFN